MKHKHLGACKRLKILFQLIKAWFDFWKYEVVFFPCAVTFSLHVYELQQSTWSVGWWGLHCFPLLALGRSSFGFAWINTSHLRICWWLLPSLLCLLLVSQKFRRRFQASNLCVLVTFVLEAISFSKLFLQFIGYRSFLPSSSFLKKKQQ